MRKFVVTAVLAIAALGLVSQASADTGKPTSTSVSYSGSTLTVSGTYDCQNPGAQAIAVFKYPAKPDDTADSLQQVSYGKVANTAENLANCTSKSSKSYSVSYTNYPAPSDGDKFCTVVYHVKSSNATADGSGRQKDNSWEEDGDGSYLSGTCSTITVTPPPPVCPEGYSPNGTSNGVLLCVKTIEVPVEKIVYVDKVVYVDKIVYVDRPIEKIVEKIVTVNVPVEKIVEKPVVKVVYKTKYKTVIKITYKTKTKVIVKYVTIKPKPSVLPSTR